MAIILTDAGGSIIAWSRKLWETPGEYANPIFHVVLCDMPEDRVPAVVTDMGPESTETFETNEGPIICPRVHRQATIETRQIGEIEQWQL